MKITRVSIIIFFFNVFALGIYAEDASKRHQSDSIYAVGVSLYNEGRYKEAIKYFEISDKSDKENNISNYDNNDTWIASCYYKLGNVDKAKKICRKYYDMPPIERQKIIDAYGKLNLASLSISFEQYESALWWCQSAAEAIKDSIGSKNYMYGNARKLEGLHLFNMGKYEEASSALYEAKEILANTVGIAHPDYAEALRYIAALNMVVYTSSIDGAISSLYESLEIDRNYYGEESTEYAQSLLALGTIYEAYGKKDEAFYALRKARDIFEATEGRKGFNYAAAIKELAKCYLSIGNYKKATDLTKEAVDIYEKRLGKEHTLYSSSLAELASYYALAGNWDAAISIVNECINNIEEVKGEESTESIVLKCKLASYTAQAGRSEEAIEIFENVLSIIENVMGQTPFYAETTVQMADLCYLATNDFQKALSLYEYARPIYLDIKHPSYAGLLNNISVCHSSLGNIDKAIQTANDALTYMRANNVAEGEDYLITYNNLANCYLAQNRFQEAVEIKTKALDMAGNVYGKSSEEYFSFLCDVASLYNDEENYAEAVRLQTEAQKMAKKLYGTQSTEYCQCLCNLAQYKLGIGQITEAFRLINECRNILEAINTTEEIVLAGRILTLRILGDCYRTNGDYNKAIKSYAEAMELVRGTEYTWDYGSILNNLGICYSNLGDYDASLNIMKKSLEHAIEKEGPGNHAVALINLAIAYFKIKDYDEALKLINQAAEITEMVFGKQSLNYTSIHSVIANIYNEEGNYKDALAHCEEALNIFIEVYGKNHPEYIVNLCLMQDIYSNMGNYELSAQYGEQALKLIKGLKGVQSEDYVETSRDLTKTYAKLGLFKEMERMTTEATERTAELVKNVFSELSSHERGAFWKTLQQWFDNDIHQLVIAYSSSRMQQSAYDAVLLSKGLLLNSDIEFSKLIQESGDSMAVEMFNEMKTFKIQIAKLKEKPVEERYADVDSLERVAQRIEKKLVDRSKVYGDFTKNLVITWPQVQEKLGEQDAAVEFVSFPLNADSTMYIAYVLRKDWDCPRMIPLFEEKELEAIGGYDYYTTPSVSHLVWEPLEEVLEGSDRVYFSPGGDLYNIAIESVPDHQDPAHLVSDRRDYYRLSSTRELALIQDDYTWTEGAVYGGLDYNMGVGSLAADEAHYAQSSSEGQRERGIDLSYYYLGGEDFAEGIRSDRKSSGLLTSLPGTREEAVAIKAQLDDISVPSSLYTDDLGTEASFKALDGQRTSIIHIGTHGFFNTKQAEYQDPTSLLMTSSQQSVRVEDDALSRSGLCMAGANNLLTNAEALPDSLDDGWLTALEIAHLDLRGLDMVVLSACKTGVGEVTGDGVFGLQRGFKKAGARTLVMSLWNVPDQLTCYFMKEFFARISVDADGHPTNKHAAFLQAQQAARTHWQEVDPNAAPYDWAAFILLDGI